MHDMTDTAMILLREEFPSLSLEGDTDIERYFDLRKEGRMADALSLYERKLRKKYPDDAMRAELLRAYRSRDPRFRALLAACVNELAGRAVRKAKAIVDFLTRDIDSVNLTDAYAVIKLAEGLLSVISPDRYAAIAFAERYARLARLLEWKAEPMERTAELLRLYVTDTIDSVLAFRKDAEERRKRNLERAARVRHRKPGLDLSAIAFSEEDLRRILLPRGISGTEDSVIAFCLKYWNLTEDRAFEKTVLLYSRKYRTKHYDIFAAIKNGREHGWKDEEILNAVLATVVTGYYYSISGDLYLQRTWARYKASLSGPAKAPEESAAPAVEAVAAAKAPAPKPTARKTEAQKAKRKARGTRATKSLPARAKGATEPRAVKKAVPAPKAPASAARKAPVHSLPPAKSGLLEKAKNVGPAAVEGKAVAANSIADLIRKETGKSYTVYKDLFFKGIRPSIRDVLVGSGKRATIFSSRQNEAEEIIYNFMFEQYNNPYQNWGESEERGMVERLGYAVPMLEPIIAHWIKRKG